MEQKNVEPGTDAGEEATVIMPDGVRVALQRVLFFRAVTALEVNDMAREALVRERRVNLERRRNAPGADIVDLTRQSTDYNREMTLPLRQRPHSERVHGIPITPQVYSEGG